VYPVAYTPGVRVLSLNSWPCLLSRQPHRHLPLTVCLMRSILCNMVCLLLQVHSTKRQDAMAPMHDFLVSRFKSMEELLTRHGVLVPRR
jgi:hypothetical protein